MKTWTTKDESDFDVAMGGYWSGWSRTPPGRKRAYVDMLHRFPVSVVKAAMLNLVKSQEIDRVPQPGTLFGESRAEEKRMAERARARGKVDGGIYISQHERELASLVEYCVEICDARGLVWRFIPEGLVCEDRNLIFPWNAAKPGQQERLIKQGLEALGHAGAAKLYTAEEIAKDSDFWEQGRVNHADPKIAASYQALRARLRKGHLPAALVAAVPQPQVVKTFEDEVPF